MCLSRVQYVHVLLYLYFLVCATIFLYQYLFVCVTVILYQYFLVCASVLLYMYLLICATALLYLYLLVCVIVPVLAHTRGRTYAVIRARPERKRLYARVRKYQSFSGFYSRGRAL
jgi:hypothetical protein